MDRVLIVDDEEPVRRTLARLLTRESYACTVASSAEAALPLLAGGDFQLVLSDVNMPGVSGLDFVRQVLAHYPDVAVIMVTGLDDPGIARTAIDIGAYGYILKPFEANEVLINITNALRRRTLEIENRGHRERLELMVRERTTALQDAIERLQRAEREVRSSQEETIQRLSKAAEFRDNETAQHIERMSRYCGLLCARLGMPSERAELVRIASSMHDVGKIGTPDQILLKPGRLTPEEFGIMKQHSEIGYRILTGSESELLSMAAVIAWTHHEKVDGSGYPRGIKGVEIPIEGRIAAIADVFDALTSRRVYKAAMSIEESLTILRAGRGTHFDAPPLDMFLESMPEVLKIREQYADG
ncbi:MAG: response regulator [Deltaproteobacteria bacterium]|nr:response regulator [Deltaproteobacteria bacterium]